MENALEQYAHVHSSTLMICDCTPRPEPEIHLLVTRLLCFADDVGLTDLEVQKMIGLPPQAWPLSKARLRSWRPEIWQETRLRLMVELGDLLGALLADEAAVWVRTPNAAMFGRAPISVLLDEVDGVRAIVVRLRDELSA